ncbi:hypothetical protein evm_005936 [Chilo suppressalis]|nr:hypothetical protein evm_005936 [Chilo suppressalis]
MFLSVCLVIRKLNCVHAVRHGRLMLAGVQGLGASSLFRGAGRTGSGEPTFTEGATTLALLAVAPTTPQ